MSLPSTLPSSVRPAISDRDTPKNARLFLDKVRAYCAMFFWLLGDVFSHYRWGSLRVLLSGALYLGSRYAAVGVMYLLISLLENKRQDSVLGFALPSPESPALLALGVGAMLVCLFAAAAFNFGVRRQCVAMGRQYEEFCGRRVMILTSRLPHADAEWATREASAGRAGAQFGYARVCGRLAAQLGEGIPALAGLTVASIILLVLDPGLTAIIAFLALLTFIAQYPANRRAAGSSHSLHANRGPAGRRLRRMLTSLRSVPVPLSVDSPVLDRAYLDDNVSETLTALALRRRVAAESRLAADLGSSMILAAVLVIIGSGIIEGSRSWGEALVYVAALRFALRDFAKSMGVPVLINRFYTEISYLHAYTTSASHALKASECASAKPFKLVCFDLPALRDTPGPLIAEVGTSLAVIAPRKARLATPGMLFAIQKVPANDTPRQAVLMDTMLIDPQVPLRTSLALPESLEASHFAESLKAFAPNGQALGWVTPDWLDCTPEEPWDTVLPEWAVYALQALAAIERGQNLIMIGARAYGAMETRWQKALRACLAHGLLFLVHNKIGSLGSHGEKTVILCDSDAAREWAEWDDTSETRSRLTEAYARIAGDASLQPAETADKEILEEEADDENSDLDLL